MNKKKVCWIFNIGPHYRFPIYNLIGSEIDCDIYLGDRIHTPIKKMDYKSLSGFKKELHNVYVGPFYWQRGAIGLLFRHYDMYFMEGEPYCLSSWVILLLSSFGHKKTVAWTHGWYGYEKGLKKYVKKLYFSLFDKMLVYGDYAINLMKKEGVASEKMFCIANSLDSDAILSIRKGLKGTDIYQSYFHNSNPVLIYCGRIQKIKKIEMIFESAAILKNKGLSVNLVFVGKDVDGVNVPSLADYYNMKACTWMYGPCYDDKVIGELFYNADICISPGNVGLTAIHSLSFGCPVITHDNFSEQMPEFEVIKAGLTGDFFVQNDVNSLADIVEKWISKARKNRDEIRKAAFNEIDSKWNVHYQLDVIKKVIDL